MSNTDRGGGTPEEEVRGGGWGGGGGGGVFVGGGFCLEGPNPILKSDQVVMCLIAHG